MNSRLIVALPLLCTISLSQLGTKMLAAERGAPTLVRSIEGISEYRLDNGAQILLYPDQSQSRVTVNMTIFVGSRHEGYGEAGMAHLLEHMLFKGTPSNPDIPKSLTERGASFNGTTWLDRTNYYETLAAANDEQAKENLEFAVRLEADRLVNSNIRGEDLASEMTVVRNEFERGENSPQSVLRQRMFSAAYEWHNYGRSTIGNRSDIERVPVDRLKAFYRKFYRPDNVMLVVAGRFDVDSALETIQRYFGILEAPEAPLDRTYTTEPPQDGERTVTLRRVGNTQIVAAGYHVPSGPSREFAAVEMLAYIFGTEPAGRLYKEIAENRIASSSFSSSLALHDPGLIMFGCELSTQKSIDSARQALLQCVEGVADKPITEAELRRAQAEFRKSRELRASKPTSIAIDLTEWAAQGDWRLYFLFRDYVEQVTPEECTTAAKKYLTRNNRTLGLFIPTDEPEQVEMPQRPDLPSLLADYQGRGEIEQGEQLDPAPAAIESRTTRGQLSSGIKTALLPKRTSGKTVNININLRYGNEESLTESVTAIDMLPRLLLRGTESLSYEALQDRFDELTARVSCRPGPPGLLRLTIETKRESLEALIPLIGDVLRKPALGEEDLDLVRRELITGLESNMTEPMALGPIVVSRILAPFEESNIRYVPTLEQRVERMKTLTIDQVKRLHATQLSGTEGEVTAVGDFDPEELTDLLEGIFADWKSDYQFARIPNEAQDQIAGRLEEVLTPGKKNALYFGALQFPMRDDADDYPALLMGNYILGGSSLSSRLGDRVRKQEGLSYTVASNVSAHPVDQVGQFQVYAIANPENREKLIATINEEFEKILKEGITAEELEKAKQGYLQEEQLGRTGDGAIAAILSQTIFAKRDMSYYAKIEAAIADLDVAAVNAALRKYIDPQKLVTSIAGDFKSE